MARQLGIRVENQIHAFLKQFDYHVLQENEMSKKFDEYINGVQVRQLFGIDHLIHMENTIICIQDKWTTHTICKADASEFTVALYAIKQMYPDKRIVGIFVSKSNISVTAKETVRLSCHNCHFIESQNYETIFSSLMNVMYSYGNYISESDNCVAMLDTESSYSIIQYQAKNI